MLGFETNFAFDTRLPGTVVALVIGLLIGAEREWSQRQQKDERVMAGIRTFGLLGLLGGLSTLLNDVFGTHAWAVVLLAVSLLVVTGYVAQARATKDWGMTTEVAMLVTFVLGVLASSGKPVMAGVAGVVVAALLSLKGVLHTRVHQLKPNEVSAALKLLFISVVVLPLLPNQVIGPLQVFNPYVIWWMVVLIAALEFAAYIAIRVIGQQNGILLTAGLGGMVSSTAMTLTLARLSRLFEKPDMIVASLLLTAGLMFPRVLIVCGVIAPDLVPHLAMPLVAATLIYLMGAGWFAIGSRHQLSGDAHPLASRLQNPFDIQSALKFTAVLVVIMFAVELSRRYFGDSGVYIMAGISGGADVDAIALSLSRLVGSELTAHVASQAILLAALSNSFVKLVLAWGIAGNTVGWRVAPFLGLTTLTVSSLMLVGT